MTVTHEAPCFEVALPSSVYTKQSHETASMPSRDSAQSVLHRCDGNLKCHKTQASALEVGCLVCGGLPLGEKVCGLATNCKNVSIFAFHTVLHYATRTLVVVVLCFSGPRRRLSLKPLKRKLMGVALCIDPCCCCRVCALQPMACCWKVDDFENHTRVLGKQLVALAFTAAAARRPRFRGHSQ